MKTNHPTSSRKASRRRGESVSTCDGNLDSSAAGRLAELVKLAVDTHGQSYTVARQIDNGALQPPQKMPAERFLAFAARQQTLAKRVVVCYEAGPFGFHLARQLQQMGIQCLVIAPQNWDERNKRTRTDSTDTRAMLSRLDRYLAGNREALWVVRIPSVQEERARDQGRLRQQLQSDRQRYIGRGRSLLHRYGINRPGKWYQDLEDTARLLREAGQDEATVHSLLQQLVEYQQMLQTLSEKLKALTGKLQQKAAGKQRPRIKGVGLLSQELLDRELVDWHRFRNRRQIASYTGLCSGHLQSGVSAGMGLSINKCGNRRLRTLLVEMAWFLPRLQPEYKPLAKWKWVFQERRVGAGVKKKAIVALARRLAVDLWRINTGRATPQQLGLRLAS